jgi:hypothetical protein
VDDDKDNEKKEDDEKKKFKDIEKEQALLAFLERGGFSQVLKDIFNPSDMSAMELDSVFQLKNLCKDFYRKKQLMSASLLQSLDALSNERPVVLQMKRRHFNTEVTGDKKASLEWMRINAERERLYRFKSIAKDMATSYYLIMDRFTNLLMNTQKSGRRDMEHSTSKDIDVISASKDQHSVSSPKASVAGTVVGTSTTNGKKANKMQLAYRENQLHNTIRFICDYLRHVIENGSKFTAGHFFIMLL